MLQTCKIYVKVLLQTCNLRNSKKLPSKLLKHTYKKRFLILKKYIKKLQDTIQAHITLKLSVFLVIYISIKELSSALARGLLKCTESFLGSCIFEKFATLTDVLCEATLCTRDCSQWGWPPSKRIAESSNPPRMELAGLSFAFSETHPLNE